MASQQQNAQQVAKPGLYIDTDLPLRKESCTLTPITKGYKKLQVLKRLKTIEEN